MDMAVTKAASLSSVSYLGLPAQGVGKQALQYNSTPIVLVPTQLDQVGGVTSLYVDDSRGPGQLQSFTDTAAVALASLGQLFTGLLIITVAWLGMKSMMFHPAATVKKPTETKLERERIDTQSNLATEREFEPIT
jgi:hypothetical protein